MNRRIALTTLVVADYDEAIAWYTGKLGFALLDDIDQGSITWQNGRFIARDERGTVLADVPDHCE